MAKFGRVEYWNQRYLDLESHGPYEWYQSYHTLRHLLSVQAPMAATKLDASRPFPSYDRCRVLILGCGSSAFGEDMVRDGWKGPITNLDFSPVVVEQMKNRHGAAALHGSMEFVCADATKGLPFEDRSFDLIICKGTLDAILSGAGSVASAKTVVAECARVLANGHGVLFLVSTGNPDSRVVFLEHENDLSYYWKEVSIHNLPRNTPEGRGKNDYVYICRKRIEDVAPTRLLPRKRAPVHGNQATTEQAAKENIENLGPSSGAGRNPAG